MTSPQAPCRPETQIIQSNIWRRLFSLMFREPKLLLLWLICSIILSLSSAGVAFIVGPILRVVFGGESLHWSPLLTAVIGPPPDVDTVKHALPWVIAFTAIIKASSFLGERIIRGYLVRRLGRRLRGVILSWAISLKLDERQAVGQGEIQHRLTVDVERVERWLDKGGASLLRDGLTALAILLSMILLSGYLGLVTLMIYPFLITPILLLNKKLKTAARGDISTAHSLHLWSKYTEDHLTGIRANQREVDLYSSLDLYHDHLERAQSKLALLQGIAPSLTELMVSLLIASSLFGFTYGLDHHWWSAEELLSLFVCIIMLYQPMKSLSQAQQQWTQGYVALERCLSFTSSDPSDSIWVREDSQECVYPSMLNHRVSPLHSIHLEVSAIHRGDYELALCLQHTFVRGGLISISGPNGCGKSSLLFAIAQLLEVNGHILFKDFEERLLTKNEINIRWLGLPTQIMHKNIERYLLSLLVTPLVLPKDMELESLLDAFSFPLNRFISSFSQTIDQSTSTLPVDPTLKLWDTFESLSLGEKQKLGLASVLSASSGGLLLLDEPESHLDTLSKRILIDELKKRSMFNLIIIATHDSSLIEASSHHIKLPQLMKTIKTL